MHLKGGYKKAFTLVELLVVVGIIGLLSTVAVVAMGTARAKGRDTRRLESITQLQTALALYYEDYDTYPLNTGWPSDCGGATDFQSTLQPLVSGGYIDRIPTDPFFPNDPWPQCFFYQSNETCGGGTGDSRTHPYILIFRSEVNQYNFRSWNGEANRWCLFPD